MFEVGLEEGARLGVLFYRDLVFEKVVAFLGKISTMQV